MARMHTNSSNGKPGAKAPKPIVELASAAAPHGQSAAQEAQAPEDTAQREFGGRATLANEGGRCEPDGTVGQAAAQDGPHAHGASAFQEATVGAVEGFGRTVWAYANEHPHATLYGLLGLVLAVLILIIGLWDTIVIALFVGVGTVIGQMVDGDNALVNCVKRWLDGLK